MREHGARERGESDTIFAISRLRFTSFHPVTVGGSAVARCVVSPQGTFAKKKRRQGKKTSPPRLQHI